MRLVQSTPTEPAQIPTRCIVLICVNILVQCYPRRVKSSVIARHVLLVGKNNYYTRYPNDVIFWSLPGFCMASVILIICTPRKLRMNTRILKYLLESNCDEASRILQWAVVVSYRRIGNQQTKNIIKATLHVFRFFLQR